MARAAKAAAAKVSRKRLTPEQKSQIAEALSRGEHGNAVAAKFGISAPTVYALKRKGTPVTNGESPLRAKLVSYAVRILLGQNVTNDERDFLTAQVKEELVRKVAQGI